MTYLITGATGFVGQHLIAHLKKQSNAEIIGTYRKRKPNIDANLVTFEQLDMHDSRKMTQLVAHYQPDYIIHLAAESSVGYSWQQPIQSFNNNVNIFLNLLEAVRISKIACRILSVGSSESYGVVEESALPLQETNSLNPISPYAVARVAQEMLSKVYIQGYGLDIVLTRSFNHTGPKQDARFVLPSFIRQLLERKGSKSRKPIETGDLSIVRDFVDVRDVVKAYTLLLEKGKTGEIYNVCSGTGYSLQQIIDYLSTTIGVKVATRTNPKFIRPNDNPIIIGDRSKIRKAVGWSPTFTIEQTLEDVMKTMKRDSTILHRKS